jgi:hypothetical protein
MVSFVCDNCAETVKKPKLRNHMYSCGSSGASCLDCGVSFKGNAFEVSRMRALLISAVVLCADSAAVPVV